VTGKKSLRAAVLRLHKEKHGLNKKYSNKVKKIEKFDAAKKREKSLQQLKKTDVKSDLGLVRNYYYFQGIAWYRYETHEM